MTRRFVTVGPEMNHGPFWYNDDDAWRAWLDEIQAAVMAHDPWALLVERPDCDAVLIDVLDGWRARVKRFNGRTVTLVRPDGWEP